MCKQLIILVLILQIFNLSGQEKSYDKLIEELDAESSEKFITFPGKRLVNGQSTEIPGSGELHLMINHRFGQLKSGSYELYGLDQAEIRIGFDYGINKYLSAGFGRSSYQKTYDINIKSEFLKQKKNGIPLNASVFISGYHNSLKYIYPEEQDNFNNRQSYITQILLSHAFNGRLLIQFTGGWLHENYNLLSGTTKNYGIASGGICFKIIKRVYFNTEYYYVQNKNKTSVNPLSFGIDLDTGGHLFQLIFSNTQSPFEKSLITDTSGEWINGEIYFGFNLIRVFYIKNKKNEKKRIY